jgi:RNA polymerase sigma-70 factor (ECF subfamily)
VVLTQNRTSAQQLSSRLKSEPRLASLYSSQAERVRRELSRFGVPGADIDDLSQEVFLVVTDKGDTLSEIVRMDLWLREVCRKVAAGYRRRGFRKREVAAEEGIQVADESALLQSTLLESREDAERLYRAVSALDDESRDLIAMHELGGMPLVEVAQLVERDRKTVRKRLAEANRRLSRLFHEHSSVRRIFEPVAPSAPEPASAERAGESAFQILGSAGDISVGLIGTVLIAFFRGPPALDSLALLDEQMDAAVRLTGSGLVYLAVIDASPRMPTLEARKKVAHMLKRHSKAYGVFPHVLLGGFSSFVRPIMAGLAFLSGVPLAMPFFASVERAAAWLAAGYLRQNPVAEADLLAAVQALRELT